MVIKNILLKNDATEKDVEEWLFKKFNINISVVLYGYNSRPKTACKNIISEPDPDLLAVYFEGYGFYIKSMSDFTLDDIESKAESYEHGPSTMYIFRKEKKQNITSIVLGTLLFLFIIGLVVMGCCWFNSSRTVDKKVEKPTETVKEVEKTVYVDKIVEKPIETVKEVEKVVYIDKPIETVKEVEKPVEVIKEIPGPTVYVDNPQLLNEINDLKAQLATKPKEVEKPVEVIKEVPGPTVYVDKPIETIKEVEKVVYIDKPVEVIKEVEKIVYVDKIVEKPIETIKEVEKVVYIEKPIEVIKEVEKVVYIDKPVETIKEVEKVVYIDKPVETIKEVEKPVEVIKEVPKIEYKDKIVEKPVDNPTLKSKIEAVERVIRSSWSSIDNASQGFWGDSNSKFAKASAYDNIVNLFQ